MRKGTERASSSRSSTFYVKVSTPDIEFDADLRPRLRAPSRQDHAQDTMMRSQGCQRRASFTWLIPFRPARVHAKVRVRHCRLSDDLDPCIVGWHTHHERDVPDMLMSGT